MNSLILMQTSKNISLATVDFFFPNCESKGSCMYAHNYIKAQGIIVQNIHMGRFPYRESEEFSLAAFLGCLILHALLLSDLATLQFHFALSRF